MKKILVSALSVFLISQIFVAPTHAATTTITYWTHENAPAQKIEKTLIAEWEAKNPGVKVTYTAIPEGSIYTKFTTSLAAKSAPDLINIFRDGIPLLASQGLLSAAPTKNLSSIYSPAFSDAYKLGGVQVGLPHEVSSYAFWINKGVLTKAGLNASTSIPKTWKDLAALCKTVNAKNPGHETFTFPLFDHGAEYLTFDQMVRSAGGIIVSKDGKTPYLNSKATIKALTTLQDIMKTNKCTDPKLGPTASVNIVDTFGSGTSASMASAGTWYAPYLKESYPDVYKNYAVAEFPKYATSDKATGGTIYLYGLHVPKSSANQKLAWSLAEYLISQGQRYFNAAGIWLGDTKTFNSAETAKSADWAIFKANLLSGAYTAPILKVTEFADAIAVAIESVVLGSSTPKAALDEAQKKALAILK